MERALEPDRGALAQDLAADGEVLAPEGADAERWDANGLRPGIVCVPATAEAVASALARCDRAGAAVIPWGGGTQQRLGLPPRRADVALVTARLNRMVEHEPADLTATVEAGMPFTDFQAALGKKGQRLPLDPPLLPGATVGGLVATNATGPRRLKDGGLRDLVIGTRVANVDGTVTRAGGRVVKNVTGYDLNKAHVGGLGTLGIVVEVAFKVAPHPEIERSWFAVFPTAEAAGRAAGSLARQSLAPTALDLVNDRAAHQVGLPIPSGRWALVGRAGGFRQSVERHLTEFEAAARSAGALYAEPLGEDQGVGLWSAYSQMAARLRWSPGTFTCRLALPPAAAGSVCDRLAGLDPEGVVWAHATGALFWSVPAETAPEAAKVVAELRELVEALGGGLIVENRPPELRGVDVWGAAGGPVDLMRAIKQKFDPRGTLNPGRFVGGI